MSELVSVARSHGVRVEFAERQWMDGRVDGRHQGVIADCHDLALADEKQLEARWEEFERHLLILVLDGITDPRNLASSKISAVMAHVWSI